MAVTSNTNPTASEILLSMDSSSGVTIDTSANVVNNWSIAGNLIVGTTNILQVITDLQNNSNGSTDLTNYYTKI